MGTFSVRLTAEMEERLNKLSVRTGRTKAFYVKQALLEHLDVLEGYSKTLPAKATSKGAHTTDKVLSVQQLVRLCEIQDDVLCILLRHEAHGNGRSS